MMSDNEIRKIVRGFTKGILSGRNSDSMCYAVCAPLQGYLEFCGCKTEMTECEITFKNETYHHWYLTMEDGRIIDPTSDQFGLPKYIVKAKPEFYSKPSPELT